MGEDEPVERDQAQRLQNGPENPEGGAGESGSKIALDELPEEVDIPVRGGPPDLTEDADSP